MHIEVMLMDDVKKLGKSGQIVKVAPGYARNFLFPKGLASLATEAAKRKLKKLEAERAARAAEEKKAALEVARKLEKLDDELAREEAHYHKHVEEILEIIDNQRRRIVEHLMGNAQE